jgi:hypothetical protein
VFCPRIVPALFFPYLNVPDKVRSINPAGSINKLLDHQPLFSASTTVSRDFRSHGFSFKYPTFALINHQLFFRFCFPFCEDFHDFRKTSRCIYSGKSDPAAATIKLLRCTVQRAVKFGRKESSRKKNWEFPNILKGIFRQCSKASADFLYFKF